MMEMNLTLPTLEGFAQHLEELLTRDQKDFARQCREVWPQGARQMADDLSRHGYFMSEGKCLYIRNAARPVSHTDYKAIKYIIARKEADAEMEEIARLEAEIRARKKAMRL